MRFLYKYSGIVMILILLTSCDVLSGPFTSNYFEQFSGINPFDLAGEVNFANLTKESKDKIIEEYTVLALSNDSKTFFKKLSDKPTYRDGVADYYRDLLVTKPVLGSATFEADLALYQKRSLALANIEIFTRTGTAVKGFNNLVQGYITGEIKTALTVSTFMTYIFKVPAPTLGYTEAQIKEKLKDDLSGFIKAGSALESLGSTIVDKDNPKSAILSANDGDIILISCMLSRIAVLSGGSLNSVLNELTDKIYSGSMAGTTLKFPQDIASTSSNILEHYLGAGGATAYTATGFQLPGINLFGGASS